MEKVTKKAKTTKPTKTSKVAKATKTSKSAKATKATKTTKAAKVTKTIKKELSAKDRKKVTGGKNVLGSTISLMLHGIETLPLKDRNKKFKTEKDAIIYMKSLGCSEEEARAYIARAEKEQDIIFW